MKSKNHLKHLTVTRSQPAVAQSTTQIKLEGLTEALQMLQLAQRAAPWFK